MKKKVLSGVFALAVLVATYYGVNKSMNSNAGLSDLALANVEALAENETITIDCDDWYKEECVTLVINGTEFKVSGRRK